MFRDVMKEKKTDDMKEKISWKVESAHQIRCLENYVSKRMRTK